MAGIGDVLGVPARIDRRRIGAGFALGYGALLALAAVVPWFWALPPLLVLAGASMTLGNTAANSLLQASVEPSLLGQAVSLYMLAMRGGSSLGALLTGATVTFLGVRHALLLDGLLAVGVQLVLSRSWLRDEPRG